MLRETDRVATGQQRVDRVAFAAGGKRLAAICPRYDRVVIYQVEARWEARRDPRRSSSRAGRWAWSLLGDRFIVLERPRGDQRHVEPGWWEVFDLDGSTSAGGSWRASIPTTSRSRPTAGICSLLSSGRAEGDPKKPLPALEVIVLDFDGKLQPRRSAVSIFDATDDPDAADSLGLGASTPRSCWPSPTRRSRSTCRHPSRRGWSAGPSRPAPMCPTSRTRRMPTGS